MNIEEIMKPYFEKKEELEKKQEVNNKYVEERNLINLRLERLRDNKDREIEEYVMNAVSDRPDFYAGYGAMIRKDLEQAYAAREQDLQNQIKELDEKMETNSRELSRYHRVDVRELIDVKHNLRKSLISAKKDLEIKFQETNLQFDAVMYKLSTFKYEYDENHNVLNGSKYRELFELSNSLIEVKYNLQKELKQIDEYLKITELTEEEVKTVMMSMTDLEKEEYNRRKNLIQNIEQIESSIKTEEVETTKGDVINNDSEETNPDQTEVPQEIISEESVVDEMPVQSNKAVDEYAKEAMEAQKELEYNYSEFIKEVFGDVIGSVKKLRAVRLEDGKYLSSSIPGEESENYEIEPSENEQVELVNGLYLNQKDVDKALNNYVKQNKGRSFIVKGIDLALNVTKKSVRKVKEILRDASTKKLLVEKKLSLFDIKRVFGKEKSEKYNNSLKVDASKANMPTGTYIHVNDVYSAFKELFVEKAPTWKEKLTAIFRRPDLKDLDEIPYEDYEEIEEIQDAEYEQVEDTMTWDAEEPEYEVVKAKSR